MNKPLASIVVPVYNVEDYLEEALLSLLTQTFANIEIIAVNDGSTDNSMVILEQFLSVDKRLRIFSQKNQGLSSARNTGILNCSGDYILLLDSDDKVAPNFVASIIEQFIKFESDMVCFDYASFEDNKESLNTNSVSKSIDAGVSNSKQFFASVLKTPSNQWVPAWTYAFKKDFLLKNELQFTKGILHEDVDFIPRAILKAARITYLPQILYFYRIRQGSITQDPLKTERSFNDHYGIIKNYVELVNAEEKPEYNRLMKQFVASRVLFLTNECLKSEAKYARTIHDQLIELTHKNKWIKLMIPEVFYHEFLESSSTKRVRVVKEYLLKWPRLIYNYKIKKQS